MVKVLENEFKLLPGCLCDALCTFGKILETDHFDMVVRLCNETNCMKVIIDYVSSPLAEESFPALRCCGLFLQYEDPVCTYKFISQEGLGAL